MGFNLVDWVKANWVPMVVGASVIILSIKLPVLRNIFDLWRAL